VIFLKINFGAQTRISLLKSNITRLQEALDITSLGQLSSVLISPYKLSVILQQVSLQLPAGLSMLTGLTVQEMYVYFAVVTPYMLTKCTQELYTVCPSDMMLKTAGEPNCLTALFLSKMDIKLSKCKRLVINETFEPVWI